MKRLIINEEEKLSLLNLHINSGYRTIINENSGQKSLVSCERMVKSLSYRRGSDTSLITPSKWEEYFTTPLSENDKLKNMVSTISNYSKNNELKKISFSDVEMEFNIKSNYYDLKERCCVKFSGEIANYDFNKTDTQNEDNPIEVLDYVTMLIPENRITVKNCD
jgi:hypothetical protein